MEVVIPVERTGDYEDRSKAEVLAYLEPEVDEMMQDHLEKRRMWMPSDFLPADEAAEQDSPDWNDRLRERARGLGDAIRVSLLVNLLTEEGLPHFHRLLSKYLGDESVWQKWNGMWTSEEDRHGCVLRDYVRDSRIFSDFRTVEVMQTSYQEAGFEPSWDRDPYRVFVYTTLQERATQYSHQNTGKLAGDDEPLLKGILGSVAADEAKHFSFYRKVFKSILRVDPNRALESALAVMPSIEMPGASMPHFKEMADVIRRMGIYGPWEYKAIVDEAIKFWQIEVLEGLNEAGRRAQDKIMAIPKRLQKVAEYIEQRSEAKTFSFKFLSDRALSLS